MQLHIPYSTPLLRCLFILFLAVVGHNAVAQTVPPARITDWTHAGLQDSVPLYKKTINIINYGADNTGITANDAALQAAITAMNDTPGYIYFPPGTYKFNQSVAMRDSLVLQGNGRANTKLLFDLNHVATHMFNFHGSTGSTIWDAAQPAYKDDSIMVLVSTTGINPGDWLQIYGNDIPLLTSSWAYGTVGQIIQVKAVHNDTIVIKGVLRRSYDAAFSAHLKPISPIQGAGIECMYIERQDSTIQQSNNIDFENAVNCWVIGVESNMTNFSHIAMTSSAHLLARGNYLHHSHAYGGTGQGYGVNIQYTSGDCKVENNNFEHLRHSMLVQAGANGNVFAYNYSKDPYWDEPPLPTNSAGDAVCHGNYPYLNLFEGNMLQQIVIDNSHGINGPFNTFFRNRAQGYGIFMNNTLVTDSVNFAGNEVTNTTSLMGNYTLYGTGHYEYANNIKGTITPTGTTSLNQMSLFSKNIPGYWTYFSWPGIGVPFAYNSDGIPAYYSADKTDCRENPHRLDIFVEELKGSNAELGAYPNPANGLVTFRYNTTQATEGLYIQVTDVTGRQVARLPLQGKTGTARWYVEGTAAGMYIYQMRDTHTILQTGKILIR